MHRLLAESLYRGYSGKRPNHQNATLLATHSVRWFHELLLRLSIQGCIDQADPMAAPVFDAASGPTRGASNTLYSRDEALWYALCEGRLILRVEGADVKASMSLSKATLVTH